MGRYLVESKYCACLNSYTFLICVFLEPRLKPYITTNDSAIESLRCIITSHFKPNIFDFYWLKNGFRKIALNEEQANISGVLQSNNTSLLQPYRAILQYRVNHNYSVQGYYQCAVFAPRFMTHKAISTKLQLQFQGKIATKHLKILKTDSYLQLTF